jgi:hypothetical protein
MRGTWLCALVLVGCAAEKGPPGPAGSTGPMGAKGDVGNMGNMGLPGTTGNMGDPGATGPAGPAGEMGVPGTQGPAGPAGELGPPGPTGPAGVFDPSLAIANGTGAQNASFHITGSGTIARTVDELPLFVTAPRAALAPLVEFRHQNLTQGVGIGFRSLFATGSNDDQELSIFSRGAGALYFNVEGGGGVGVGTNAPAAKLAVTGLVGQRATLIGDAACGQDYAGLSVQGVPMSGCSNYTLLGNGTDVFINRTGGGAIHFRANNGEQMTLGSTGALGVGVAPLAAWAPSLAVAGPLRAGMNNNTDCDIIVGDDVCFFDEQNGMLSVRNAAGNAYAPVRASSFNQMSTLALKKDVAPLGDRDYARMRAEVDALPLYRFRYKHEAGRPHTGVLAEKSPKAILSEDDRAVNLYDYVGLSVGATKGLSREVDSLRAENAALKARLDRLERKLATVRH